MCCVPRGAAGACAAALVARGNDCRLRGRNPQRCGGCRQQPGISVVETELLETKELPQTASAPVPLGEAVLYPGLCLKQHGQQTWRGSAPLPCAGETLPGIVHPDVESSVQKRHGLVGTCPEKGHENDPRHGTPLLKESWGCSA